MPYLDPPPISKPCFECQNDMLGISHHCIRMVCHECGGRNIEIEDNPVYEELQRIYLS